MANKNSKFKLKPYHGLIVVAIAGAGYLYQAHQHSSNNGENIVSSLVSGNKGKAISSTTPTGAQIQYGKISDKVPSQTLAESVLTAPIKKELGDKITWNGTGAFNINGGKSTLNANVSSAPYATNTPVASNGQLGVANALLSKATRQYQSRDQTTSANGKSNSAQIKPAGWKQIMLKGGSYATLYNRGHLLGYALVGGLKNFDASEANPDNIASQTAWANQASNGDDQNTGQNYYEGIVRKALDKGKTVRYQVKPIYDGSDLVPMGNQIQAKSKDGSVDFNVFVPNVEPGVAIDYSTGQGELK